MSGNGKWAGSVRILVVDDNQDILRQFSVILRHEGYLVWEASTGKQGLQLAHDLTPNLVILDVMLPDLSGLEVCRAIKSNPELSDVFVVLCSGVATSVMDEISGLDTGADDYFTKPIQLDGFLARVRTTVRLQQALAALRASDQHYRQVIAELPVAVCLTDLEGRIVEANEQALEMLGYSDFHELLGKVFFKIARPEDHKRIQSDLARTLKTGVLRDAEYIIVRKDGRQLPIELNAGLLKTTPSRPHRIISVFRDVERRQRAEEEMRRLPHAIIKAQETERKRVARELHDGVNQLLASAKMRLRNLEQNLEELVGPAGREKFRRCNDLLVQALEENRRIAHNLRPSDLDELGLEEACRNLCLELESRSRISIRSDIQPVGPYLSSNAEPYLFRIVQEAVTNVEKHAGAKTVHLEIAAQDHSIVVRIKDDGNGFNPDAVRGGRRSGGSGLANMRERAVSLGGTCEILSAPAQGTSITIRVPRSNGNLPSPLSVTANPSLPPTETPLKDSHSTGVKVTSL